MVGKILEGKQCVAKLKKNCGMICPFMLFGIRHFECKPGNTCSFSLFARFCYQRPGWRESELCGLIGILKCNKKGDHGESLTPERRRYNVLCRQRTGLALGYSRDTKNSKDHKLHDRTQVLNICKTQCYSLCVVSIDHKNAGEVNAQKFET